VSIEKKGIVIRDPWYEFATNPAYPDAPNQAFQDTMASYLSELNVRWVRLEFHIAGDDVEAEVARNDYFINEVAPRYNLKVLGLLSFDLLRGTSPRQLMTDKEEIDPLYGGGVNAYMHTWLDRARFIANRYQDKIHAYEILNEHNRLPLASSAEQERFANLTYRGRAIPPYLAARLHTKFYHFFHNRDREDLPEGASWRDQTPVIIGGLHPKGTGEPDERDYLSDLEYLHQLYTHPWGGFPDYHKTFGTFPTDGLGYHPYPEEIRGSLNRLPHHRDIAWETTMLAYRLDELRQELRGMGHPDVPFWITEIGYNIAYGNHDTEGQAAFLEAVQRMLPARADVATSFWFKYEDFPGLHGRDTEKWGLVHIPYTVDDGVVAYDPQGTPAYTRLAYHTYSTMG
jgi:hypothetical protein